MAPAVVIEVLLTGFMPPPLRQRRESGAREVDRTEVCFQVEEPVVGQEGVDHPTVLFELGELAHPSQMGSTLDIEVLLRWTTEHEGEHDLHEEVGLEMRLGRDRLGEPRPRPRPCRFR